jgi:SSS family solute:Na+ symporter
VIYFITGATIFSSFAFLGAPGWAYSRGAAVFYILGYGALGFLPFYFLGPRAARVGRAYGILTQAEMVARRFNAPAIAGVMALISIAALIPYLALQIKGAGYVLNAVTGGAISAPVGGALVYGVVLLYVLRSGVLGVGWTNTFQGVFMMVLAWGLGLYLPYRLYGGVGEMFAGIVATRPELLTAPGLTPAGDAWSWAGYSSAVVVSILGFCVWPHLFMKAFTARDDKTLKRSVVLYPTFQIFLVPLFLIGFAGVSFGSAPQRPDQILPHMLMQMDLPAVLVGLFCAGALAASMSSGDAMAHAAASIGIRDGLVTALGIELKPETQRRWIRWLVVLVIIAAYAVAVSYQGSLVQLLLTTYGAVVQFMPVVVATLYWKRATGPAVLAALIAGSAVTVFFVTYPDARLFDLHAGLHGVAVNVVLLVSISLLSRSSGGADDQRFLEIARRG